MPGAIGAMDQLMAAFQTNPELPICVNFGGPAIGVLWARLGRAWVGHSCGPESTTLGGFPSAGCCRKPAPTIDPNELTVARSEVGEWVLF